MTNNRIFRDVRRHSDFPIETARAIAVIALVSFHVIGGGSGGGLDVGYPHPLRYYADLLVDIRMPLFAFIAGAVYAMKPVPPQHLGRFIVGKLRRLALPGMTAITIFLIFATAMGTDDWLSGPFWQPYLHSYAIFWFLQAMLLIFAVYGTADILSEGRVLMPALVASALAVMLGWRIPSDVMAADRVTTLLFYVLLGIAFMRHRAMVLVHRRAFLAAALMAAVTGLVLNLSILGQSGALSTDRLDLQSLLFGTGLCVTALLALPVIDRLRWLGAFSLTIYLYHILATSAARRALSAAGVESPWLHVTIGTAAGILLPVCLHLMADRAAVTRLMVLGLRPRKTAVRSVRAPLAQH